jgi:putative lipoic acid-binding regulatory protein
MSRKPVLEYPCQWLYKIIGANQEELQQAAAAIINKQPCTISLSNSSKTGKYHCLNIEVEVTCEKSRNTIYQAFKQHPQVKMVL